jgi:hypothetical protein
VGWVRGMGGGGGLTRLSSIRGAAPPPVLLPHLRPTPRPAPATRSGILCEVIIPKYDM